MQAIKLAKPGEDQAASIPPVAELEEPAIVTTPYDALELVFDYIGLRDLCSVGLTCKRLQQVAGHYFRLYYPAGAVKIFSEKGKIKEELSSSCKESNLARYAKKIQISNHNGENGMELFCYVAQLNNNKLKCIDFVCFDFSRDQGQCLADTLKSVETIEFLGCDGGIDHILRFCLNLKSLAVTQSNIDFPQQTYPTLEHLCLDSDHFVDTKAVLFVENNPQIKMFSSDPGFIGDVSDLLDFIEKAQMHLDYLQFHCEKLTKDEIMRLNDLQARGHFRQLGIKYLAGMSRQLFRNLKLLNNLDALEIHGHIVTKLFEKLREIPGLCKLELPKISHKDTEMLWKSLSNLDELSLWQCSHNSIVRVVRNLPKLKKLRISGSVKGGALNAERLNGDRMKLPTPRRKLTIYLNRLAFKKTRWASIDLDYEMVQIRRISK